MQKIAENCRKLERITILLFSGLWTMSSCTKDETPCEFKTQNSITIGEKLENPYSLSNMQKAYNTIMEQSNLKSNGNELEATFIDLVDNNNQGANNDKYPFDEVCGYTMAQLSKIALDSYGLKSLKETLKKNKPAGVTDAKIDKLFKKYEEEW